MSQKFQGNSSSSNATVQGSKQHPARPVPKAPPVTAPLPQASSQSPREYSGAATTSSVPTVASVAGTSATGVMFNPSAPTAALVPAAHENPNSISSSASKLFKRALFGKKKRGEDDDDVRIGAPTNFAQRAHVNREMTWIGDPNELFELKEIIGEGSYGHVHRAVHRASGVILAIKILTRINTSESQDMLLKEVNILRQCSHSNIVVYYGCCVNDDRMWIVTDYCGLGAVSDVLKWRTLTEAEIRAITHATLSGLKYLHEKTIIHRDLKGGNILLTDEGVAKIADFGVASVLKGASGKAQTVIGTPLFMAPEILCGQPYSYSADVWSFGITLIELAEGLPPHVNEPLMRALYRIANEAPPQLKDTSGKWSKEFVSFVSLCLQRDPVLRGTIDALQAHPFLAEVNRDETSDVMADLRAGYLAYRQQRKEKKAAEATARAVKSRKDESDADAVSADSNQAASAAAEPEKVVEKAPAPVVNGPRANPLSVAKSAKDPTWDSLPGGQTVYTSLDNAVSEDDVDKSEALRSPMDTYDALGDRSRASVSNFGRISRVQENRKTVPHSDLGSTTTITGHNQLSEPDFASSVKQKAFFTGDSAILAGHLPSTSSEEEPLRGKGRETDDSNTSSEDSLAQNASLDEEEAAELAEALKSSYVVVMSDTGELLRHASTLPIIETEKISRSESTLVVPAIYEKSHSAVLIREAEQSSGNMTVVTLSEGSEEDGASSGGPAVERRHSNVAKGSTRKTGSTIGMNTSSGVARPPRPNLPAPYAPGLADTGAGLAALADSLEASLELIVTGHGATPELIKNLQSVVGEIQVWRQQGATLESKLCLLIQKMQNPNSDAPFDSSE